MYLEAAIETLQIALAPWLTGMIAGGGLAYVSAWGLLYARHARMPARARPLLYLVTGLFLLGALLATASNQRVDFHILAYHAMWHVVGAFGFIALWAFNHVRFDQ